MLAGGKENLSWECDMVIINPPLKGLKLVLETGVLFIVFPPQYV
jgi:hypothetical protein